MTKLFSTILLFTLGALLTISADARRRDTAAQQMTVYDATAVDVRPEFPGGDRAMLAYINRTLSYPESARAEGIHGRVLCGFVVTPEGELTCVSIVRGVEASLDREALRIISAMPRWSAGRRGNETVAVYCVLPIGFKL